jgi:hypothetical protein
MLIRIIGEHSGKGTSTVAPPPATSAVQRPSIPGIGATRADWNASHTPNAAYNNGFVYGDDPSLPSWLAPNGGVYIQVSDLGTGRIQVYAMNMHAVDRDGGLARVRQELPSDATVAWDLMLDECYRVAFNSATLQAAGPYMAEAQLEDIQKDGTRAPDPRRFNQASFTLYGAGTPPNPEIGC